VTSGVRLHVTGSGNEVMRHIADLFAEGLTALGAEASVVVDGDLPTSPTGEHHVVVAPHEYFPLHFLRHRPTIDLPKALAQCAVLAVEQPGSDWFEVGWAFARQARRVFDISPAGVAEFVRRGVDAVQTPLGFAPSLAGAWTDPATRALDVVMLGHRSPRRLAFIARHAEWFAARRARIVLSDVARPRRASTPGYVSAAERLGLMASTRIVLSVHSSERPYFEQHRALLALAGGAAYVTERSEHTSPLRHGHHFLMGAIDELPSICDGLLGQPGQLAGLAAAGYAGVRSEMTMVDSCRRLLSALEAPAPREVNESMRTAVRERIAASRALLARGETPWTATRNAAATGSSASRVSVVVTLFNYEAHVEQCLESVIAAETPPGGAEIVVVDDASTDGSAAVVERVMAAAALPITLVRKTLNTGLADARNIGVETARGTRVFILDADNWILPHCLRLLDDALGDGAAAAYGLIARYDQETGGSPGLLSALDWDVSRLVESPYIDAMALFDRRVLRDLGGYAVDLIEHGWFGWEDYDLWLSIAQAGHQVKHVPQVVARYREHPGAMLRRTNRDTVALARHLERKFTSLITRHPGLESYFAMLPGDGEGRSDVERERDALRVQVQHLERQIADIRSSLSWRLTGPLRALLGPRAGQSDPSA
jgi:glycosyltransferase involved in cell wall biosynthesis